MLLLALFSGPFTPFPNRLGVFHEQEREVVVVTGASAGVGRATVRAFARRGASIGLIARGRDGLNAACEEVEALGGQALAIAADVADAEQVEAAASSIEDAFGPIDIWVNNAMASVFSPAIEMTPADYQRVTEVTYLGYVYGALAALKRMRPPRPRRDSPSGVRFGLPWDSPAVSLLRRQACRARLHRIGALRAAP